MPPPPLKRNLIWYFKIYVRHVISALRDFVLFKSFTIPEFTVSVIRSKLLRFKYSVAIC